MKNAVVVTAACMLCFLPAVLQAQPDAQVQKVLQSKTQAARRAQALKSPVVSLQLSWRWDARYSKTYRFRNRFRPGSPIEFSIPKGDVKTKTTLCAGAAVSGGKAVTHKNCFAAPNENKKQNFVLQSVSLTLKNGRTLTVPVSKVQYSGEFAFVAIPASFTQGIKLAEVHVLPNGQTLQDVYGEAFGEMKLSHAFKNMESSSRFSRRLRNKPAEVFAKAMPGQPLFWRGKLVALSSATADNFWNKIKNGGENFIWTAFYFANGASQLI